MTGYAPLNTLKPVAEGLWLIDGPAVMHRRIPIPTRATVVRLLSGDLWVHAPTELTAGLQSQLAGIGPVAHLVVPGSEGQDTPDRWQSAYPQARVWWGAALDAPMPWADEMDHLTLTGARDHRETVFFHRRTETLIVADLVHNLDTATLPPWARPVIWLAGTDHPNGAMPPALRRVFRDRDALAEDVARIIAWRPKRMILCHGRWYPSNAVGELERAFRKVLRDRMWMQAVEAVKAREGR